MTQVDMETLLKEALAKTTMEVVQRELELKYFLVKRSHFWRFMGGVAAFLVAVGFISYKAVFEAIERTGATAAVSEITKAKGEAIASSAEIKRLLVEAQAKTPGLSDIPRRIGGLEAELRTVRNGLATTGSKLDSESATLHKAIAAAQPSIMSVGCAKQICVFVDAKGWLYYGDTNSGSIRRDRRLGDLAPPLSISCEETERCVIVDSKGLVWQGNVRESKTWARWGPLPSKE